jgi:hypothetical protein
MKIAKHFLMAMFMVALLSEYAEAQKLPGLDPSPADIAIMRTEGPKKGDMVFKITYGRPSKKGRTMLGGTEKFGEVWRLGANESTEIKVYRDVTFGDKKITPGTYTLYAIPNQNEWTLIFNSKLDTWGAFQYEKEKDVARISFPTSKTDSEVEAFTIACDGSGGSGTMAMAWENTMVKVPFKY